MTERWIFGSDLFDLGQREACDFPAYAIRDQDPSYVFDIDQVSLTTSGMRFTACYLRLSTWSSEAAVGCWKIGGGRAHFVQKGKRLKFPS
jgi:hypothetical protein